MKLSGRAKVVGGLFVLLAILAYVALAELAMNAGKVHHGVSVQGFDIGGLSRADAEAVLGERGEQMQQEPMRFVADGFYCLFTPKMVGWGPQEFETADEAMAIGRQGGVFAALRDRWRAWTSGIEVAWTDRPKAGKMGRELARCEKDAEALGYEIDRPRLRFLVKRTITTWPREPVEIPLLDAATD